MFNEFVNKFIVGHPEYDNFLNGRTCLLHLGLVDGECNLSYSFTGCRTLESVAWWIRTKFSMFRHELDLLGLEIIEGNAERQGNISFTSEMPLFATIENECT